MNVEPPSPLHGPEFSSYAAAEVSWLLTDLSHVALEAPAEQREAMMQAKAGHYAESLPIEYQPTGEYLELFHEALAASAERVAHAVGVVTELVLAARDGAPVLVSLARAGTPVGILMRRWAQFAHGVQPPHYAVSIVRGRGIDGEAMRYLARHHDPARVMFVDGWTGKGAICRELTEAVTLMAQAGGPVFDPQLAVLADPGGCTGVFGTRDDFLIPSACLNSTVSGLVSRTVLNDRYIGPGQFHGAKFYKDLAPGDVSELFLDAVEACFPAVAARVAADWPVLAATDRTPDWSGWNIAVRLAAQYGLDDVNLLKPGVGETTRVLLRRSPWRVLIRPDARGDLGHILLLAKDTGVPVDEIDDLPYACVGLIRPRGGAQ
ncbi:cysteine protease StiP family protein [Dactylosporangium sp. NBC_01737]|uniref:cysteine protease StiP family protein n=1 Tax=Dactylosporangium sp. NBC_01737 TaxID=2975959 RepID=UPI002E14882A|nr:cysteine protease StiP family protein [Dactylosporangium sp. NBC_01737]